MQISSVRKWCFIFSKKILHSLGLEELLVDAQVEYKCIQQFF